MNKTIAHQLITTIGSTVIFNSYQITNYYPIHFKIFKVLVLIYWTRALSKMLQFL